MSINLSKRKSSASTPQREGPSGLSAVRTCLNRLSNFAEDTAGDVAMLFGLMAMIMFMFIGAAVDMGRWLNARDQTMNAIDSAVLAAGRALQTNGGNETAALAVAQKYYDESIKNRLKVSTDSIRFEIADSGTSIKSKGNAYIKTPFLGVCCGTSAVKSLPLLKESGVEFGKATLAVGGNSELNIEISMMLDVSGSMGQGSKLADMKDAASDLVDIVVWQDQGTYTSKVAIVPFSGDVRPPVAWIPAVTGTTVTPAPANVVKYKYGNTYTYKPSPCVGERPGTDKYKDTAPGAGNFVLRQFTSNGNCSTPATGEVMPMTNVKANLISKINGLTLGGGTAGQIGTAWASYMLSPNWSPVLSGLSLPVAYSTPKTKKIAILMTDGAYNSEHDASGITIGQNGAGASVNVADSPAQARAICTEMKAKGIEVYTVGFDLGGDTTATTTLSQCATDASKFYNAEDAEALKRAFRDIALKISQLYLSK